MNICPEGVIGNDLAGNVILFNPSAERLLGYTREEVIGKINVSSLYPKGGAREAKEFLYSEDYGGRGRLVGFETELLHKAGRIFPISLSCAILAKGGAEIGIVGFFSDISARKAAEREFIESQNRFRNIVETASDAIFSFEGNYNIVVANRAAEDLLEYGKGELTGRNFKHLIPSKYGEGWGQIERYATSGGTPSARKTAELILLSKTGREIPVQISMSERQLGEKKIVTAIIRDISAQKAAEEELRLLSITDTLTQLHNRRHFYSLARKELERSKRTKAALSLLLIDIDNFKRYNDTYGHTAGDQVLVKIGEVMRNGFRSMNSCFRLGGEEFVVLMTDTGAEGAMVAAERFRVRYSEVEFRPLPGGKPVTMTISIGISEYRDGDTVEDLVHFADLAMYAAKNSGRNRTVSYADILPRPTGGSSATDFPA